MMRTSRLLVGLLVIAVLFGVASCPALCRVNLRSEESMGREYAADVEKDVKLVSDQAVLDRVQRIGQTLAKIANEYEAKAGYGSSEILKFKYQFKVIEDKSVNAMSLPGGIVYVNTGLLDLVENDDELAGVLAHEIAHAAHHHMSYLLSKRSSVDRYVALIALAGILGKASGRDLNNMLLGAQMMSAGKLSSYTQEAERDADRTGVAYLVRSPYKPEGMLAFMKQLEAKQAENPSLPLGIFQDHPAPYRRVLSVTQAMRDEGLSPDVRRFQDVAYARTEPVTEGSDRYQVVISKKVVCEPAALGSGASSKERADMIARKINALLDKGLAPQDIGEDLSRVCLLAKGDPLLEIESEDAKACGESRDSLLRKARAALEYAVWADWLSANVDAAQARSLKD